VNEIKTSDGFYKYYYGRFESVTEAREALVSIRKMYGDAFVKNLYLLRTQ
jgi:hypothetical protein